MILVDDALLADVARKNKKVLELAAKNGMGQDLDSGLGDLFSSGVNRQSILKEISIFSQEKEDDDLL